MTDAEFKIIYENRFPVRQRRPDGTWGCRGCGSAIPKGRQTWCSSECNRRYDPRMVLREVVKRDKGFCQICGFDSHGEKKKWHERKPSRQYAWYSPEYIEWIKQEPLIEYDHITPFSEGGLTVVENMRTLCRSCHVTRTGEWRKMRSKSRNQNDKIT